jgi:signal peptide peptidase SppA
MKYGRIIAEFAGHPCALDLQKFEAVATFLRAKALGSEPPAYEGRVSDRQARDVARQEGSVMVLPVVGMITQRPSGDEMSDPGLKLQRFQQQFRSALADDDVKAIVLDIDSPGGSVFGVPETAQEIYEARGQKTIVAVANSLAASAAYWIASAAEDLAVTPSGMVGSIGVYTVHQDISQFLESEGIRETIISAGRYKAEAAPTKPLDDEARDALQSRVDTYYDMFVDAVARNRNVRKRDVTEGMGQGRPVQAQAALSENMVDRVATLEDVLARFGAEPRPQNRGGGNAGGRRKARALAQRDIDIMERTGR